MSATESYIINGKPARPGQFPYQAALVFTGYENAFDGQYCSGTLIEPQWVLTAGHCVTKTMSPGDIQVLVNVLKLSTGAPRLDLAKVCRHPQYKITGPHAENDIALIKLATPLTGVPTIKIPNADVEPMMFQFTRNATISGWGDTGSGNHAGSDDLLFGTVRVVDNRICSKSYPHGQIIDGMVCATDQFTNTCRGDSGCYAAKSKTSDPRTASRGRVRTRQGGRVGARLSNCEFGVRDSGPLGYGLRSQNA